MFNDLEKNLYFKNEKKLFWLAINSRTGFKKL